MVEEMNEHDDYIKNINGKVLSHYLQEFEHVMLDEGLKYCTDKKYILENNCS